MRPLSMPLWTLDIIVAYSRLHHTRVSLVMPMGVSIAGPSLVIFFYDQEAHQTWKEVATGKATHSMVPSMDVLATHAHLSHV